MMRNIRSFDEYDTEAVHLVGRVLQYFNTIAVIPDRAENVYTAAFHRWPGTLAMPTFLHRAFSAKLAGTGTQRESLIVPGKEAVSLENGDDSRRVFRPFC